MPDTDTNTATMPPEDHPDATAVASLLVPDDTPQITVTGLIQALEQVGFIISHRDGFDARTTVAYDISAPDQGTVGSFLDHKD